MMIPHKIVMNMDVGAEKKTVFLARPLIIPLLSYRGGMPKNQESIKSPVFGMIFLAEGLMDADLLTVQCNALLAALNGTHKQFADQCGDGLHLWRAVNKACTEPQKLGLMRTKRNALVAKVLERSVHCRSTPTEVNSMEPVAVSFVVSALSSVFSAQEDPSQQSEDEDFIFEDVASIHIANFKLQHHQLRSRIGFYRRESYVAAV